MWNHPGKQKGWRGGRWRKVGLPGYVRENMLKEYYKYSHESDFISIIKNFEDSKLIKITIKMRFE